MPADATSSEVPASLDEYECRQFVAKHPKSADGRFNLARALIAADDPAEAVEQCSSALAFNPKMRPAARLLAALLQRYALNASIDISPRGLEAAFAYIDVDRQALGNAAIVFLKEQPPLAEILACGRTDNWEASADMLLRKGQKLLKDRLFAAALTHSVISDVEVEFLLTALRKKFLLTPEALASKTVYEFVCLLIRQCHNNEHVYFATPEEIALVATLEPDTDGILSGRTKDAAPLLLLALYRPLPELVGLSSDHKRFGKVSPRALRPVLKACLAAKQYHADHAGKIPQLSDVTDETSRSVANQYEESPYPLWLSLQTPEPGSATSQLSAFFGPQETSRLSEPCSVLIAGAGTGQQAISSAIAYGPQARILAIDLSLASLAYGEHMAKALAVENIRFAQADILNLSNITERFDVIECCGVLHHMADPFDAWRRLIDRLQPGGLMHIGLYSAVSRSVIENFSRDPAWPGADADDTALRMFRHALMQRREGDAGFELTASIDFFSKSGFRDLALHVSETRCTIPEIQYFMAENGLDFRGFLLPPVSIDRYRTEFPDDPPAGTLDHWAAFEQDNPRTFDGMYLFWCRRANQS